MEFGYKGLTKRRDAKILRKEQIAKVVGLGWNRVTEIIGNTNFGKIDNLLSQGLDMDYIAGHYHMDVALIWA